MISSKKTVFLSLVLFFLLSLSIVTANTVDISACMNTGIIQANRGFNWNVAIPSKATKVEIGVYGINGDVNTFYPVAIGELKINNKSVWKYHSTTFDGTQSKLSIKKFGLDEETYYAIPGPDFKNIYFDVTSFNNERNFIIYFKHNHKYSDDIGLTLRYIFSGTPERAKTATTCEDSQISARRKAAKEKYYVMDLTPTVNVQIEDTSKERTGTQKSLDDSSSDMSENEELPITQTHILIGTLFLFLLFLFSPWMRTGDWGDDSDNEIIELEEDEEIVDEETIEEKSFNSYIIPLTFLVIAVAYTLLFTRSDATMLSIATMLGSKNIATELLLNYIPVVLVILTAGAFIYYGKIGADHSYWEKRALVMLTCVYGYYVFTVIQSLTLHTIPVGAYMNLSIFFLLLFIGFFYLLLDFIVYPLHMLIGIKDRSFSRIVRMVFAFVAFVVLYLLLTFLTINKGAAASIQVFSIVTYLPLFATPFMFFIGGILAFNELTEFRFSKWFGFLFNRGRLSKLLFIVMVTAFIYFNVTSVIENYNDDPDLNRETQTWKKIISFFVTPTLVFLGFLHLTRDINIDDCLEREKFTLPLLLMAVALFITMTFSDHIAAYGLNEKLQVIQFTTFFMPHALTGVQQFIQIFEAASLGFETFGFIVGMLLFVMISSGKQAIYRKKLFAVALFLSVLVAIPFGLTLTGYLIESDSIFMSAGWINAGQLSHPAQISNYGGATKDYSLFVLSPYKVRIANVLLPEQSTFSVVAGEPLHIPPNHSLLASINRGQGNTFPNGASMVHIHLTNVAAGPLQSFDVRLGLDPSAPQEKQTLNTLSILWANEEIVDMSSVPTPYFMAS